MKKLLAVSALAVLAIASPSTQALDPMTAEDILKVTTVNVLDLSEDGRRVAVGARRTYDNAETNHRRYGDPTYFVPSMVELRIIDTRTGAAEKVGPGLINIRQAAWTRDGSRLALLTAAESASGLPETKLWIYHADRKTLAEVPRQRGAEVAANSELAWTPDGSKLFVALRSPADASFANVRKLTDLNPWLAKKALPGSELVSYRDADGKVLYGVLRYPIGYEKGKKYPTVFEL